MSIADAVKAERTKQADAWFRAQEPRAFALCVLALVHVRALASAHELRVAGIDAYAQFGADAATVTVTAGAPYRQVVVRFPSIFDGAANLDITSSRFTFDRRTFQVPTNPGEASELADRVARIMADELAVLVGGT